MDTLPDLHAPLLDWALWYAALGWPVFPCHGKEPVQKGGFHTATTDETQIRSWWSQWPACNIGAPMGHWSWALDIDPRHGGDMALYQLEHEHTKLPDTMRSLSGRGDGGGHYFWSLPPKGIHNKAKISEGLDVIAAGAYIILPPSIHPETLKPYVWDYGPDELLPQQAPEWLEALIAPGHQQQERVRLAPNDIIQEGTRETTLVSMAGSMRHHGATAEEIYAAIGVMNLRCEPPLDDDALQRIAHSIERYPPAPQLHVAQTNGTAHPPPVGWSVAGVSGTTLTMGTSTAWRQELFTRKNGDLIYNEFNVTQILRYHDHWQRPDNLFWHDVIRERHMCGDAHITKKLLVDIGHWFGGQERLSITSFKLLEECVYAHCEATPRDLLQSWLNSIPAWDRIPRLHTWLRTIATVPITTTQHEAYVQEISRRLLVSLVARAMNPGCQYREVVILQGPENIGKSHIAEALVTKEWFVVLSMNLETKESHMMLQHAWLAELADLDSLSRTEDARLKAFITMEDDTYIPKYKNESASFKRRTVLLGTTNEEHFLKGQTGNTRFLPIRLTGPIHINRLRDIREQLFAEALQHYLATPETWWHMPEDAQEVANEERELRRIANEYEQPLHEWLDYGRFAQTIYHEGAPVQFTPNETSWAEIATWFLKIDTPERWKDRSLQMQIASALKILGWKNIPVWHQGRTTRRWRKQDTEEENVPF